MSWHEAFFFHDLHCTNAAGNECVFETRTEGASDGAFAVWEFYARPKNLAVSVGDLVYHASFRAVEPSLFQLDFLSNGLPDLFQGYGITRALIPLVALHHSVRIRSSQTKIDNERRSQAATKVWQRMVSEHTARYDSTEDRYYYPAI